MSDGTSVSSVTTSWNWNCTADDPTVCEGSQTDWSNVECDDSGRVSQLTLTSLGLTGHLPTVLGFLEYLQVLDLRNNSMSGPLPTSLGHLLSLEYLDVSMNDFSGTLPTSLGKLTRLESLLLADNEFTGAVSSRLCGLSLTSLELYDGSGNGNGNSGLICYYPCLADVTNASYGSLENCSAGELTSILSCYINDSINVYFLLYALTYKLCYTVLLLYCSGLPGYYFM